jgi:hypothetical protein
MESSEHLMSTERLPLWLKLAYSAFMAVLVPVYWYYYGPTNFLYFCDVALILQIQPFGVAQPRSAVRAVT